MNEPCWIHIFHMTKNNTQAKTRTGALKFDMAINLMK